MDESNIEIKVYYVHAKGIDEITNVFPSKQEAKVEKFKLETESKWRYYKIKSYCFEIKWSTWERF